MHGFYSVYVGHKKSNQAEEKIISGEQHEQEE